MAEIGGLGAFTFPPIGTLNGPNKGFWFILAALM